MRDRPDGANTYSIAWHHDITHISIGIQRWLDGSFTERAFVKRTRGKFAGFFLFQSLLAHLPLLLVMDGWTPWCDDTRLLVLL